MAVDNNYFPPCLNRVWLALGPQGLKQVTPFSQFMHKTIPCSIAVHREVYNNYICIESVNRVSAGRQVVEETAWYTTISDNINAVLGSTLGLL